MSLAFLAACGQTEYVFVTPDVPYELRTPVAAPDRQVRTLKDVGVVLTDHVEALETANGKIAAIDCILAAAESGKKPLCVEFGVSKNGH